MNIIELPVLGGEVPVSDASDNEWSADEEDEVMKTVAVSVEPIIAAALAEPIPAPKKIITEDLGLIFEMAICLLYGIKYNGTFKYSLAAAHKLKDRLGKFKDIFPYELNHTAAKGHQYDFTGLVDTSIKLSAKTTKEDGKVCPQLIGQATKKKFRAYFGLDLAATDEHIKKYIEENVNTMLTKYDECTFDCPIIYYNEKKNKVQFIRKIGIIDWDKYKIDFTHITKNKTWNESSSISIGATPIGEFQVHAHRNCIKFRWGFEKFLPFFKEAFEIVDL